MTENASRKLRELGSDNLPNCETFSMRSQVLTSNKPASKAQMRAKSTMGVMAWSYRLIVPACAPLWHLAIWPNKLRGGRCLCALFSTFAKNRLSWGVCANTSRRNASSSSISP